MKLPGFGGNLKLGGLGGTPKLPGAPRHGPSKPRLRARHLSTAGRSAFPAQDSAFSTPDQAAGPAAAFQGASTGMAGPGDMGE